MQEKIAIRKKALVKRKNQYFEVSDQFFKPLIKLLKKIKKTNLSLYYPSNYEVNILKLFKLIKFKTTKTLLPITKSKNEMNFVEWKYFDPLKVNSFGMLDPCSKTKYLIPDVMLVPLLAFDLKNNRLGYGKGFYDKYLGKFLRKRKKIITIGVAFAFQRYDKLPVSKLDIKLDYILTEKGLQK
ncbi:5-formyltetrahydrofolate cyclo-ligase [Pelagibacteraceae bacterium]|nr:5-formyltetrahydrofolate cyclo-ligase [Pelagibacteraceae bacterium]